MCLDGEIFLKYARAERELCDEAGAVLARIISEIQNRHGVSIAEVRVTMDWAHAVNGWPAANCVMVREQEGDAAPVTAARDADDPPADQLERRP
jgi:hypothetical protein